MSLKRFTRPTVRDSVPPGPALRESGFSCFLSLCERWPFPYVVKQRHWIETLRMLGGLGGMESRTAGLVDHFKDIVKEHWCMEILLMLAPLMDVSRCNQSVGYGVSN